MPTLAEAMRDLGSVEGCSTCGWRGSFQELLRTGGQDTCPDGCGDGTMSTYYGPDQLQEHELELWLAEEAERTTD